MFEKSHKNHDVSSEHYESMPKGRHLSLVDTEKYAKMITDYECKPSVVKDTILIEAGRKLTTQVAKVKGGERTDVKEMVEFKKKKPVIQILDHY